MRWLDGITDSMHMNSNKFWGDCEEQGSLAAAVHGVSKSQTWLSDTSIQLQKHPHNCPWKSHLQACCLRTLTSQSQCPLEASPSNHHFRQRIWQQCWRPGFDPWVGKIPWRRERLPTPVFWPGEFHGLYSLWGHKESNTTEWLSLSVTV